MNDKDKKEAAAPEDEKLHITKSIFQTSREMQEKADEEARKKREEAQRKYRERQKKAAEAHDKRLEQERLELLKMKTGVIEESETIREEEPEKVKQSLGQRIGSFFYLNKWWLGIACVLVFIGGILVYDLVTKPRPDMIVLMIGMNQELGEQSQLQDYLSELTPDSNNNGKQFASVYYIPYTGVEKEDFVNSVPQKLTAELQNSDSVIIIGNKSVDSAITIEDVLVDLSELYPDDPHVDKYKFMLKDTSFAEKVGVDKSVISDDWFIAIRKPQDLVYSKKENMQETYDKDFPVFEAIIRDLSE
ncbi:MAG: cell envelope integrity protein TolA [Ruminococcus sp.]|nr:cell envelope integrity protein TolA [Ruminococcus sp.]